MRYRFCSSCTEEMERGRIGEGSASSGEVGAAMQGYNCVMIYSTDEEKILFCGGSATPTKENSIS